MALMRKQSALLYACGWDCVEHQRAAAVRPYLIEAEHMLRVSVHSLLACWISNAVGISKVLAIHCLRLRVSLKVNTWL